MEPTRTAFGTWNGGRFMHYGEPLNDERYFSVIRHAYDQGVRTFVTADVYGSGEADMLIGKALQGIPRETYSLVGIIGHDFYTGTRDGAKGYPRFTNPTLRQADGYADYLKMAAEKSLERCQTNYFDLLMLHNPDRIGYTSDVVWKALEGLKTQGMAQQLGVAPGPANGFTLDLLLNFERFGHLIDWAMIILNPFEPWPGSFILDAAEKAKVKIMARVVDYGGIFHDDVKPGHTFAKFDHRSYRPAGWVESAQDKVKQIRHLADKYQLSLLQLASVWTLSQPAVECVVPTLIQEIGEGARTIESKVDDLAGVPALKLTEEESNFIRQVGDNKGCMQLKGAYPWHQGAELADNWPVTEEYSDVAQRWGVNPEKDLAYSH